MNNPEKKAIRAELRQLATVKNKVLRDQRNELQRLVRAAKVAQRNTARALERITRRTQILTGRLAA